MNKPDLVNLKQRAELAGERSRRNDRAYEEEHAAGAALLALVIEAVRPALAAICVRVKIDAPAIGEIRYAPISGVHIAGERPSASTIADAVYLMADGGLMLLHHRAEDLAATAPLGRGWRGEVETITPETFEACFDVEAVVGHLSHLLDAQLAGKLERRTAEAEKTASKFRAICRLLEG
jgi:hypothetical protein